MFTEFAEEGLDQLLSRAVREADWTLAEILVERDTSNSRSHVDVIRDLASQGADINNQDYYKETPLHKAAGRGDTAAVELLLRIGADRNISNMNESPQKFL